MNKIKYFVYDLQNGFNNQTVNIEEFEYNDNTLTGDFYNTLAQKYVDINYNDAKKPEELYDILSFFIVDNVNGKEINIENKNEFLYDVLAGIDDNTLCILPTLPVGASVAQYRNGKIVIRSKEEGHIHFPHVHYIASSGLESVINLETLELYEGVELTGKEKKKIFGYLKDNQKFLIECYNKIVNHEVMDKIAIDIIE